MESQAGWPAADDDRTLRFTGNWREYFPTAATNALLIIATLGIYRFWAKARERRYLWSRTFVIDDTLEWTGTGGEMFVGFLLVLAIILPFFLVFQFVLPALMVRGETALAFATFALFYVGLMYFGGVARFRALRYRLSRSWWHGIRGGSDDRGWGYGVEFLGRYALVVITFFIPFPWATTKLWNRRWGAMTFGPSNFECDLTSEGLKRRWAALYLVPPLLLLAMGAMIALLAGSPDATAASAKVGIISTFAIVILAFYLAMPLMTLHWFAKFYRHAAAATALGDLRFEFDARTRDWLKLFIGNLALVVFTLGFGLAFWGYRNWSFVVRHTHLYGTVNPEALTQSRTLSPREAEGFADAFDVGAF